MNFNRPVHASTVCTVQPASEPVTLTQAKLQCRVDADITADDTLITALITAARRYAEVYQNRALLQQTCVYSLDNFPIYPASVFTPGEIKLPVPPLISVASVQYYDVSGTLQTLSDTAYIVDTSSQPGRIVPVYGVPWPITTYTRPNSVMVTFNAGYASASLFPMTCQAILMMVAGWYVQREYFTDKALPKVPEAVDALLTMESWGGLLG